MARLLNKCFWGFLLCFSFSVFGQSEIYNPKDYKDGDYFKNFKKRREEVSKWQINQLKNGAMLVRLQTNTMAIEALKKTGKYDLATQKELETYALNKNIVRAFTKYYNFSKVYFFYNTKSDTLAKGAKQGFFLDTNLIVDPHINLTDSFYLLAERDYTYNSSIGFVPKDTAMYFKESGAPEKEMAIVIKNKYYHQLKEPFPYFTELNGNPTAKVKIYVNKNGTSIPVEINKRYSSEKYNLYVQKINDYLHRFYGKNVGYEIKDPEMKPFLY